MTSPSNEPAGPRLAIVLSHATQYYSPWFRWLRENTGLNFKVFYLSETGLKASLDKKFGTNFSWDVDLTTGYDFEIVPNTSSKPDLLRFNGLRNPELPSHLRAWCPNAILLFGYNYNTHLKLVVWARLNRIPLIFRGDSHLLGRRHLSLFKGLVLKQLYRQFSAVTYVGNSNRHYFQQLRVPDEKLFFAPHAVNAEHFNPANQSYRERAATLRASLGIAPSTRVVLFAGKLIPEKHPYALLECFIQLAYPDTALVFVGDGAEKSTLQARAAARPEIAVHFLPFANQSEMPSRYLLADLFVLPSRSHYETWGLAINEAMHMGLPCLVSNLVGCQADLVTDRVTGWVFNAGQTEHLRAKLSEALSTLGRDRHALRSAVTERIASYNYDHATKGLLAALEHATGQAPKSKS
ncbi:MAG: glycosyltransferase family 4 protein [Verrucomicrobia bacterium]|nr:glycosyltransferase family 4 protein [Verrucomicrobiota bacterium]